MDVDVVIEIYRDFNDEITATASDMYGYIALDHFRLSVVVEKRNGVVLRNF